MPRNQRCGGQRSRNSVTPAEFEGSINTASPYSAPHAAPLRAAAR